MSKRPPEDLLVMGQRVRCWDAGRDAEPDRYTILYLDQRARGLEVHGMHSSPDPRGYSGHLECEPGDHLGRRISFLDLPESVRLMIRSDLSLKGEI